MHAIICIKDYSYAYPGADDFILRNVDLEIGPGECHCISGPTGSGKTTLALAMKGLLPQGKQKGEVASPVWGQGGVPRIGLVLQNPEVQVLRSTIGAEVAFGLENLCVDSDLMSGMVTESLTDLGLEEPLNGKTGALSMGQKYRLIVASHLVMGPHLLILDEPAGQLDPDGLKRLLDIILKLKHEGVSFLLCENRPESFCEAVDFFWNLEMDGTVRTCSGSSTINENAEPFSSMKNVPSGTNEEVVSVSNLALNSGTGSTIWSSVSFSILRGQRVLIDGMNGSGKTSLLRCLLGFIKPLQGEVRILGEKPVPGNLQGKIGYLFQNPQRQIFETTVFDEIAFPLKRLGKNGNDLADKVMETLSLCSIESLAGLSPHRLSYGQKHLVALACAIAHKPQLLILDDPLAGLDRKRCRIIRELLFYLNEEQGTTIIWTSHEPGAMREWAHMALNVGGGRIAVQG
jgi:energy-coupling factor transport system ATP-binding protein